LVLAVVGVLLAACAPGTPDLGYSPTGSVSYDGGPEVPDPPSLVPLADGGVAVSGIGAHPLTKITSGGAVDPTWGASLPQTCAKTSRAIAMGPAVVLSCLAPTSTGSYAWQLWRVTAAGALDPTFGGGDGIVPMTAGDQLDVVPLAGVGLFALDFQSAPPNRNAAMNVRTTVLSATGAVMSTTFMVVPVTALTAPFLGWTFRARLVPVASGALGVVSAGSGISGSPGLGVGLNRRLQFGADGNFVSMSSWTGPTGGDIVGEDVLAGTVVLQDGRIATAGRTAATNTQSGVTSNTSWVKVTTSDGSPDLEFGTDGELRLQDASGGRLDPSVLLATNDERRFVVIGVTSTGARIAARYDSTTGAIDPTFGSGGRIGILLDRVDTAVPRTGINQLYVAGIDAQAHHAVARIWNQIDG
jgi:hypothetical protein